MIPPSRPFAVSTGLLGLGEWGLHQWLSPLVSLTRLGVLDLTVVDLWRATPAALHALEDEGVIRYQSWECCFASEVVQSWKIACVVTGAETHFQVVNELLKHAPNLKIILCEKPGSSSLEQARTM